MLKTKPKFEILEEVSNGTIVAIYHSKFYVITNPTTDYCNWNKADPKWLEKYIYSIKLKEPTKGLTFEEYQNFNPELDYKILEEKYNSLPLYHFINVPEGSINE